MHDESAAQLAAARFSDTNGDRLRNAREFVALTDDGAIGFDIGDSDSYSAAVWARRDSDGFHIIATAILKPRPARNRDAD